MKQLDTFKAQCNDMYGTPQHPGCQHLHRKSTSCLTSAYVMQAIGNWQEVINDPSLNAVVIGTWPYLHRTLVLEALKAGKHVLTEARLVRGPACDIVVILQNCLGVL